MSRIAIALLVCFASLAAHAQASCSSDGVPAPRAVLERFISADCERCWQDAGTPRAGRGEIAIDWVVPGARGEDAPLATVATRDALERLEALQRKIPLPADALRHAVSGGGGKLRVAHGLAFNDYIATSIESRTPGDAWLLLLEQLPAGTEGSPVERHLVRNAYRHAGTGRISEVRSMQLPEGTKPERLRVLALRHDARGRLVAAAVSRCR